MKNKLQIITNKVDWTKVINMAFDRKDWGKVYTLYKLDKLNIQCSMCSFDFSNSIATFVIRLNYPKIMWYNTKYIYYHMKNYTIDDFKNILLKGCISLLDEVNKREFESQAQNEYSELKYDYTDVDRELCVDNDFVDDYDEIQNISNRDIKYSALGTLQDKVLMCVNEEYESKVKEYVGDKLKNEINDFTKLMEEIKNE